MWWWWLVLLWVVTTTQATFLRVSFYPAVGISSLIKTRKPTPTSGILPDPYVPVHNPLCETYAVNSSVRNEAGGPHSQEIFCRPSAPQNPAQCLVDIDGLACEIDDITSLNTNQALARQNVVAFSFFTCGTLDPAWSQDARCDTECDRNDPDSDCHLCQWSCNFGLQCWFTQDIPPMPYFEEPANASSANLGTSSSYCCQTYERICTFDPQTSQVECVLQYSMTCVLTPTIPAGSVTCTSQIQSTCSSTVISDDQGGNVIYQAPLCTSTCVFPCTNSSLAIPDCVGSQCHPSVRLLQCTINFLANPEYVCPFGGLPIVYKDATSLADVTDTHATGQRLLCNVGDMDCETEVHCLCVDTFIATGYPHRTCKNHRNCHYGGTYFESLNPAIAPLCVCNIGRFGRFCELATSGVDCNNGQESPSFPLVPLYSAFAA